MWKRPVVISSIITIIGILIVLYYAFSWKFMSGFLGFLTGAYSVIITVVFSSILLIGLIAYITFFWKRENVFSLLPLIISIIMIFLYFFSVLPYKFMTSYQKNFFEKNFKQYSQAASIMVKTNLIKDQDEYSLPFRYRFLSEDGKVNIFIRDQKEIVFFLRRGVGAGKFLVYTSSGETIFKNDESCTVIKKKPNWYYVEEY